MRRNRLVAINKKVFNDILDAVKHTRVISKISIGISLTSLLISVAMVFYIL